MHDSFIDKMSIGCLIDSILDTEITRVNTVWSCPSSIFMGYKRKTCTQQIEVCCGMLFIYLSQSLVGTAGIGQLILLREVFTEEQHLSRTLKGE